MSPQEKHFGIDLSDEVVRGSIVTYNGEILPVAPRPAPPPAPAAPTARARDRGVTLTAGCHTSVPLLADVGAGVGLRG